MKTSFIAKLCAVVSSVLLLCITIPGAAALSVSVGDINDEDDVRELRGDIEDELENDLDDLEEDCFRGVQIDLDDEEDDLVDDIENIYEDAIEEAPSNLDEDLEDDRDDLVEDAEDGIEDLRDRGCDSFGSSTGQSPFNQTSFRPFTTITPLLGGMGSFGRPLCFNGIGSFFPTYINTVPGYQNFGGTACTGSAFSGFGGFGGYSNFGGYGSFGGPIY